jgi:tetratricopeptide (TPR) repeat protein
VDSSAEPAVIREANDLFAQGKYEEASRLYLRAVLTDEQDGVARLLYGLSRFALKDFETAAVAVRGALEATPDLLTDPIDVRSFYASPTEFAAQLDGLKESTGVSFDDQAEARFLLAYLYFASGQPALSAEVLKELLADQPDDKLIVSLNESVQRVLKGQDAAVP